MYADKLELFGPLVSTLKLPRSRIVIITLTNFTQNILSDDFRANFSFIKGSIDNQHVLQSPSIPIVLLSPNISMENKHFSNRRDCNFQIINV